MTVSKEELVAFHNEMTRTHADATEKMNDLRTRLGALLAKWDAPAPPQPEPAPRLRFALHRYDNTQPSVPDGFDVYDLQRGYSRPGPNAETYLYATIVRSYGDAAGYRQFLPPSQVPDSQCAHLDSTTLVTRPKNTDTLVNFDNTAWQTAAIANIIRQCKEAGATGVYHDEVDWTYIYAWPVLRGTGKRCVEMPNEQAWQNSWVRWLRRLGTELNASGLKLWANLGANYSASDPWQRSILDCVDAINIEFFVGREGVGQPPNTAAESWVGVLNFISSAQSLFDTKVHVHCSSLNQAVVDYAFASWLLVTDFRGTFSASLEYGDVTKTPTAELVIKAKMLGRPFGFGQAASGYWRREFEKGVLLVNPNKDMVLGMPGLSGKISL